MNRTTILHATYRLEKKLGNKLLVLKKTGPVLTEAGKAVYNDIVDHYSALESKLEGFADLKMSDHKELKIITTTGVSSLLIMPAIKKFLEEYPDVIVSMETVDGEVEFKETTADVGILPTVKDRGAVTMHPIFSVDLGLYASKEYLQKYGEPKKTADLKSHKIISYYLTGTRYKGYEDWHIKSTSPENVRLRTNSLLAIQYAAKLGIGIVNTVREMPLLEDDLVRILPKETKKRVPVYFVIRRDSKSQIIDNFYECIKSLK